MPNENTETGQRQDFNDYELIQEEYLRNLGMTGNIEHTYPPEKSGNQDSRQTSQILREKKTDKMHKLRRGIEFIERGMQRVRTKLNRLQQMSHSNTPNIYSRYTTKITFRARLPRSS